VNLTPVTIHAPARSTNKTPASTSSLEPLVGKLVASAAFVIVEALAEYQAGGLTPVTKSRGGDLIAELYGLRQFMLADFDFDSIARTHGGAALRSADVNPTTADCLVDEVLILLHKVVQGTLN
jgi:hypothetical protein